MNYWPGTNIPKSMNNAFTDWKRNGSSFAASTSWRVSHESSKSMTEKAKNNITYSRKRK